MLSLKLFILSSGHNTMKFLIGLDSFALPAEVFVLALFVIVQCAGLSRENIPTPHIISPPASLPSDTGNCRFGNGAIDCSFRERATSPPPTPSSQNSGSASQASKGTDRVRLPLSVLRIHG